MSVATPPPAGASPAPPSFPPPSSPGEACPLCGAPLHPEQEWCVRCGAAARTRLAASPNWKKPIAVLAVVVGLSLGVIAAALIALAGNSTSNVPSTNTVTRTVVGIAPSQTSTAPSAATPQTGTLPSATTPQTSVPGTGTSATGTGASATGRSSTTVPGIGSLPKRVAKVPSSPFLHVKLSPKAKAEIRRALAKTAP
jgi:hypothetical protein